ncbi:hypothetical protein EG328_002497 [Venturia inaequalis]|uniref:Uncharacterized protein n=1 Tax=Venturia inaequalis TaxID=5025 RepID=A0A8H3VCQ5_VENIN|nr:hypothetical protein EG328_002497 [Venturia inaequalis]
MPMATRERAKGMPKPAPRGREDVSGHETAEEVVGRGLVERGLVERGLVERGLVERGLVERGFVDAAVAVVGKDVAVPVFVNGNNVALYQSTVSLLFPQQDEFTSGELQQENPSHICTRAWSPGLTIISSLATA